MKFDSDSEIINSRDVVDRLEELQDELDVLRQVIEDWDEENLKEFESIDPFDPISIQLREERTQLENDLQDWKEQNKDELDALEELNRQGEDIDDWRYGVALIRETYFVEYCKSTTELPKGIPSFVVIDWEETADNLRSELNEVIFDDVIYICN